MSGALGLPVRKNDGLGVSQGASHWLGTSYFRGFNESLLPVNAVHGVHIRSEFGS